MDVQIIHFYNTFEQYPLGQISCLPVLILSFLLLSVTFIAVPAITGPSGRGIELVKLNDSGFSFFKDNFFSL